MRDEVVDAEVIDDGVAIEVTEADPFAEAEVRRLPARRIAGEVEAWRGEAKVVAIAAAGGMAVGVAAVTAVNAVRRKAADSRKPARRIVKRGKEQHEIASTRSFLVDVHLLNRSS